MSELYPGSLQLPAMRYQGTPAQSIVNEVMFSNKWSMQEKKDGAWYMLEKIDNDNVYLFGRTKSKVTGELTEKGANAPHIIDWAKKYIPDGTTLIGEIYIPGGHSNDVTKIMGCLPEKAIERQNKQGNVRYYVFDCIRYADEDLCDKSFIQRYGYYLSYMLLDCFKLCDEVELARTYALEEADNELCHIVVDSFQKKLAEIFDAGGEGAVFKPLDSKYYPDKRPAISKGGCFKMKEHVDSVDLVCTALLDPEMEYSGKEIETWPYWMTKDMFNGGKYEGFPKYLRLNEAINKEDLEWYKEKFPDNKPIPVTKHYYYGWKNGMRLAAYDSDGNLIDMGRVASGLNDALREDMAKNPDNYIGKVVECSCMSIDKKEHSLRHPVFLRMRDDKDAKECLFDEL